MAASERGALVLDAYVNMPILSPTGRVLGNTGLLVPLIFFLDTIFGDVNPQENPVEKTVQDSFGHSEYDNSYNSDYNYHYENKLDYTEYPNGYSSYSQVNSPHSRSTSVPAVSHGGNPYPPGIVNYQRHVTIGDHRSLAEDQKVVFHQLSAALATIGVDGRNCLLRFICEAQDNRIQKLNLFGKMLATLLTPKDDPFMEEYNEAASLGKAGKCQGRFDTCPISLFNIFDFSRNRN